MLSETLPQEERAVTRVLNHDFFQNSPAKALLKRKVEPLEIYPLTSKVILF